MRAEEQIEHPTLVADSVEGAWRWQIESLPDELVQLILLEATIAYHQPLPRHNKGPEIAQGFEAPHWRTRTELLHSLPAVWFVVIGAICSLRPNSYEERYTTMSGRGTKSREIGVMAAMVGSVPLLDDAEA